MTLWAGGFHPERTIAPAASHLVEAGRIAARLPAGFDPAAPFWGIPVAALVEAGAPEAAIAVAARLGAETGRLPLDLLLAFGAVGLEAVYRVLAAHHGIAFVTAGQAALIAGIAPRSADPGLASSPLGTTELLAAFPSPAAVMALLAYLARMPALGAAIALGTPPPPGGPGRGPVGLVGWSMPTPLADAVRHMIGAGEAAPAAELGIRLARRVDPEPLYSSIAARLGVPFAPAVDGVPAEPMAPAEARAAAAVFRDDAGARRLVLAPPLPRVLELGGRIEAQGRRNPVVITTPPALRKALRQACAGATIEEAAEGLARRTPMLSAKIAVTRVQLGGLALILSLPLGLACLAPLAGAWLGLGLTAGAFIAIGMLRYFAARRLVPPWHPDPIPTADLPTYTVLVPLYREAGMLPQLVAALGRLDYPPERLEIKLVVEADDAETVAAAQVHAARPPFDVIVVPPGGPRTKPKALNYALAFARGALVAVYDAEDQPAPDQLRVAAAAFAAGGPDLACVQARLVIRPSRRLIPRQFAVEYAALFDGLLPFFAAVGLPLPLGGTSNHFRRNALEAVGGWDPYNVTEDADLGTRLARAGRRTAMIDSATLEAAPRRPGVWLRQRVRWIKGWLTTWLVHMRRPRRLWRELGPHGFLAFQAHVGAIVLSSLVHPFGLALLAATALHGVPEEARTSLAADLAWAAVLLSVLIGYGGSIWLARRVLRRAGRTDLLRATWFMPVYWLMISAAAWCAVVGLVRRPHYWAKTPHAPVSEMDD